MSQPEPSVRLRTMTADEFSVFLGAVEAGYAHDIEVHGGQTHDGAVAKAKADMAIALPQGIDTPDHVFYIVEADRADVGRLWVAERPSGGRRVLFIFEVAIDPAWQGRGYGRAAMNLAEGVARERGLSHIELNVFGANDVARHLYKSLGYVETSVQMRKALDSGEET